MKARVIVFQRPAAAGSDTRKQKKGFTGADGRAAVRRLADVLQVLALTRPADVIAILSFAARLLVDDSFDGSA